MIQIIKIVHSCQQFLIIWIIYFFVSLDANNLLI